MSQGAQTKLQVQAPLFGDANGHLAIELRHLDLLITRRIEQFRLETSQSADNVPATPTFISDQEVEWLLNKPHSFAADSKAIKQLGQEIATSEEAIANACAEYEQNGMALPLLQLARLFDLSWLEKQVVLICLAPELRRKYDRIYAYLQDDITRKRPSLDLILDLLFDREDERWKARPLLDVHNPVFHYKLVETINDPHSPSGSSALASFLQLDKRILQYLLGNNQLDARLNRFAKVISGCDDNPCIDKTQLRQLQDLIENRLNDGATGQRLLFHMHGTSSDGRRDLVMALCRAMGCPLIVVHGQALLAASHKSEQVLPLLCRESLLLQAPILIENIDGWLQSEAGARCQLSDLGNILTDYCWLSFTAARTTWPVMQAPSMATLFNIEVQSPNVAQRLRFWRQALSGISFTGRKEELDQLLQQFQLSTQQILLVAQQLRLFQTGHETPILLARLAATCRAVSHHGLGELAVETKAHYQWDDIVLPAELKQLLRNICAQVRYRQQVFEQWGFGEKLSYGRGLSVLFSGSPGTGKTMAAQVVAQDLKLDLFKIDLSGVVSKYIGETEKNLNRVFAEAQASNAILFFDEADALFGRRTDVSDAHDRYANIEVSYLLQKMEEYDGIVMLATNLRNNIDEAFVRRIRFILEFPFPDVASRQQIWCKCVPATTPVSPDIDYQWLARRIKIAGGNIKNIVLNAAFDAAHEGAPLSMRHLVAGCKQEFQKIGKLWDENAMQYTSEKTKVIQK